jgi:asparagine synthase (glutamine-hydrolysing)
MAHGLEIRVPMLDRSLLDYVFTLPGQWLVSRDGVNKPLLADALQDRLRPELLRLRKRGFSLPHAKWMSGPLRAQFEGYLDCLCLSETMEPTAVRSIWCEFLARGGEASWSRAWLLGVLGASLERGRVVDGTGQAKLAA